MKCEYFASIGSSPSLRVLLSVSFSPNLLRLFSVISISSFFPVFFIAKFEGWKDQRVKGRCNKRLEVKRGEGGGRRAFGCDYSIHFRRFHLEIRSSSGVDDEFEMKA